MPGQARACSAFQAQQQSHPQQQELRFESKKLRVFLFGFAPAPQHINALAGSGRGG
jgi:hypothetical protein